METEIAPFWFLGGSGGFYKNLLTCVFGFWRNNISSVKQHGRV